MGPPAEGPGGGGSPKRLLQSPNRLYKAPTDYTKPPKDYTKPKKGYRTHINIRISYDVPIIWVGRARVGWKADCSHNQEHLSTKLPFVEHSSSKEHARPRCDKRTQIHSELSFWLLLLPPCPGQWCSSQCRHPCNTNCRHGEHLTLPSTIKSQTTTYNYGNQLNKFM